MYKGREWSETRRRGMTKDKENERERIGACSATEVHLKVECVSCKRVYEKLHSLRMKSPTESRDSCNRKGAPKDLRP